MWSSADATRSARARGRLRLIRFSTMSKRELDQRSQLLPRRTRRAVSFLSVPPPSGRRYSTGFVQTAVRKSDHLGGGDIITCTKIALLLSTMVCSGVVSVQQSDHPVA